MASFFDMFKTVFNVRDTDQRDNLALSQFQGVCDAFEQVHCRIPLDGGVDPTTGRAVSERGLVFYALAAARMQLAEQLQRALREEMQAPNRPRQSQARLDLEDLTGQIKALTLAASLELAQPNCTAGEWETQHHLRDAIEPPAEEEGEDTIAHARAMYNGGLVLLTNLRQQLAERERTVEPDKLATARLLLTTAQHEFDTLGPVAAQLQTDPWLFGPRDSTLHENLEAQVERMLRLLETAAAELAVPGVTQTPLWKALLGDPRSLAMGTAARRPRSTRSDDRPWEGDIWCMTSDLFRRTNSGDERARRVLQAMWIGDPNPAKTWTLFDSVQRLEREGAIKRVGTYFNACPWTDIFRAERTVRVGNKTIGVGSTFTLHVEAEPDGEFRRDVIVADFRPTDEIDYCDTEGGHDEH